MNFEGFLEILTYLTTDWRILVAFIIFCVHMAYLLLFVCVIMKEDHQEVIVHFDEDRRRRDPPPMDGSGDFHRT